MNLKVISVADGEAALEILRESPCDLLLTDLEMPNLDGLSLVAAVRDLPMHRFLPALVLSCRHPNEFPPENRQGVTGWLVKPSSRIRFADGYGGCCPDERRAGTAGRL